MTTNYDATSSYRDNLISTFHNNHCDRYLPRFNCYILTLKCVESLTITFGRGSPPGKSPSVEVEKLIKRIIDKNFGVGHRLVDGSWKDHRLPQKEQCWYISDTQLILLMSFYAKIILKKILFDDKDLEYMLKEDNTGMYEDVIQEKLKNSVNLTMDAMDIALDINRTDILIVGEKHGIYPHSKESRDAIEKYEQMKSSEFYTTLREELIEEYLDVPQDDDYEYTIIEYPDEDVIEKLIRDYILDNPELMPEDRLVGDGQ